MIGVDGNYGGGGVSLLLLRGCESKEGESLSWISPRMVYISDLGVRKKLPSIYSNL